MLANEQTVMESVQTQHNKYFIPLVWSTSLITRARKEGRIKDDYAVKTLIDVRERHFTEIPLSGITLTTRQIANGYFKLNLANRILVIVGKTGRSGDLL